MAKETWKAGNMVYPLPAVMVSAADKEGNHYGIFHYPTKEIRRFKDLDALHGELKPDFPLDFESLEKAYNDYWKSPKQK